MNSKSGEEKWGEMKKVDEEYRVKIKDKEE